MWYNQFMKQKPMITVVAALIWQGDKFLACRRPANKARALLWEFVGGKVEAGESKEAALARECMEELALPVTVGREYLHTVHDYDDVTVDLTLFHAVTDAQPQCLEHAELRWVTPKQVDELEFCPADKPILQQIKKDYCS